MTLFRASLVKASLLVFLALAGLALTAGPASAARLFVDQNVTGGNGSGFDWPNAFGDLQDALDVATSGDEIWVAAGRYVPSTRTDPEDPQSATFSLGSGVAIFGGFSGGETSLGQRDADPRTNGTVLAGGGLVTGGPPGVYHVVTARETGGGTLLDGFTVTGGRANGPINDSVRGAASTGDTLRGGGIFQLGGELVLRNLLVTGNHATLESGGGGGLFVSAGILQVVDSFFVENRASDGGGILAEGETALSISHTLFLRSSASASGGGIFSKGQTEISIADSAFVQNSGEVRGGGLFLDNAASARLDRVTYHGNLALEAGAGIFARQSASLVAFNSEWVGNVVTSSDGVGGAVLLRGSARAVMTACTLAGNVAAGDGGGIAVLNLGELALQSSILHGNSDGGSGGASAQQIHFDLAGLATVSVTHSLVEGGFPGPNVAGDPLFVRTPSTGSGGFSSSENNDYGDLRLRAGSPAIDAGDNTADLDGDGDATATLADLSIDLDGGPRRIDDLRTPDTGVGTAPIVDMGAYELERAVLFFEPFEVDLGVVAVGEDGPVELVFLANAGVTAATDLTFTTTGAAGFSVDASSCGDVLAAGASCEVLVRFDPTTTGSTEAVLEVSSTRGAASLPLRGFGATTANLAITQTADRGVVDQGDRLVYTVSVENPGPSDAFGAQIQQVIPPLGNVSWTCTASNGAHCAESGTGAVVDTVDLPVGSSAIYVIVLTIEVVGGATGFESSVGVQPGPETFDPDLDDNVAIFTGFLCGEPVVDLELRDQEIDGPRLFAAAGDLDAGQGVRVLPQGHLTLRSCGRVVLSDGFSIESGGRLVIQTRPTPGEAP